MAAEKKSSAEEIREQPIHGNGDSAAKTHPDKSRDPQGKKYRTEEFVRARQHLTDRLDRVKEEFARVDAEQMGRRMADWVKENPLLAAALAAGTGILLGRGLISVLSKPAPPTLAKRTRLQAHQLSRQARRIAGDLGEVVSDHAADAGEYILRKAGETRSEVARKATEFSDEIGQRAADFADVITDSAARAVGSSRSAAHETAELVRDRTGQGLDVVESFLGTIRTAAADAVVNKIRDLLRR